MHKPTVLESVLALFAGRARAAAIYGDLSEMAVARGRLWFAASYLRTLILFAWRTPVALLAAILSVKYLRRSVVLRLLDPNRLNAISFNDRQWYQHHLHFAHLAVFSWDVSLAAMSSLWILLPYVAIRFGLRSRLTYLAGTLFLLSIPVYTFRPQIYSFTGLICAFIIVAALASPLWRRQMVFLAATFPIGSLVFYLCITDPLAIFHPHHQPFPMSVFGMRIDEPVHIAIVMLLCPMLYSLLLRPRSTGVTHA